MKKPVVAGFCSIGVDAAKGVEVEIRNKKCL